MAVGSPLYMAPEQLRSSRRVDQRADVWALGVVLYELLTRRLPFEAESLPDLCLKVVREEPRRIAELRADVPRGVLAVIARCLEKDPGDRYANATELAVALTPFTPQRAPAVVDSARLVQSLVSTLPGVPVEASTAAPARRGHARLLGAAVAMVVALGAWGAREVVLRANQGAPAPLAFAAAGAALDSWDTAVEVPPIAAVVSPAPAVTPAMPVVTSSHAVAPPRATRVAPRPRPADDIPAFR
jgi:Protein kinase domain